jgi:hypothetical protein
LYYYRIEHCLLFSDIVAEEVEKCGYDRWLGKIHHFMQKDQDISECYQLQNITAHGLQFIYEGVDMNLLLSPHWTRPGDYFKYLSSISPSLRFRFVHRTIHQGSRLSANDSTGSQHQLPNGKYSSSSNSPLRYIHGHTHHV